MQKSVCKVNDSLPKPAWVTIREAVKITNKLRDIKMAERDIYRHALYGNICLSIYFQSPPILRKIKLSLNKIKLRPAEKSLRYRLCMLDMDGFMNGNDLILSTEGRYIIPDQLVLNSGLRGYEFVLVQRLLAHSLKMPLPVTGANDANYGITVTMSGQTYQVFEKMAWQERIKQQIMRLPEHIIPDIYTQDSVRDLSDCSGKGYFPIYDLPEDACFVIRQEDLDKLLCIPAERFTHSSSTRITTPLSRLFWLACKYNDSISPLLRHPYKLLPIFEQWASDEGITDRFSGDTLKTALERGSPTSVSASKR
ncbi:hypothetical protein [Brenneria rubrifaciens]|uniref:Uncharacterized protein n=1 Tax=Brenneria rubrifaciens TaxID=55213 RepID=A0A4P8QPW4_9GAMM|nr:hypothetical protein [Brenneria rubrifaciens]QCR09008.1 hypothetical protein EH207_10995 [Brenneria rubrifaciens]